MLYCYCYIVILLLLYVLYLLLYCTVTYYGKTYQHFFTRAAEHMGISNLTEKRVKNMKESAVSDHRLQCDCLISFDDFNVLASDTNNFRLPMKESLLIKRDKPILNSTITPFLLKLLDSFNFIILYIIRIVYSFTLIHSDN